MSIAHQSLKSEARPRYREDLAPQVEYSLPRGYEPIELVGIGAFAEVWKVLDTKSGRISALKRLRPERCDDATSRQLLCNEAQAGEAIPSRHLLKILFSDPYADVPFIVFEWLEGETLEEEIRHAGPLALRREVWIARQCADGMRDLECAGLAHGDIKPQNLFITLGGELKLLDLGFVRSLAAGPGNSTDGTIAGTPEYLAPESLSAAIVHPIAKDVYSLGITLYRMLTGRLPFVGETASVVMVHQRQTKPALLRHHRPEAPRELADLVSRMLAKQPFRRPLNLRTLVRELVDLELMLLSSNLSETA